MTFAAAVVLALSFWGARGVPPSPNCNIRPVVMTDAALDKIAGRPSEAAAYGPEAGTLCGEILISSDLRYYQTTDPGYYCAIIVHEVKHTMGYGHTKGGIMDPDGTPEGDRKQYPWPCRTATRRS